MRDSYTVTLPEEPPALPDLHKDLRPRTSMPGSLLVSTFVGLVLNKTKVRAPRLPAAPALWLGGQRRGCGEGAAPALAREHGVPHGIPLAGGWGAWGWVSIHGAGVPRRPAGGAGSRRQHVSGRLGPAPSPAPAVTLVKSPCPSLPTARKGFLDMLAP